MSIYCDCSCTDYDCADFSHDEIRRARKPHRCCECRGTIARGQRYEYATLITDGQVSHYKTCLICCAIRRDYCPHGWLYTQVAEHIYDCLGFDYREDPSRWSQKEVDEEDEAHRVAILRRLEKQRRERENATVTM